jgi:hypothetical protein
MALLLPVGVFPNVRGGVRIPSVFSLGRPSKSIRTCSNMKVWASQIAVRKRTVIYAYDRSDYHVTTGYRGLSSPPANVFIG